MADNRMRRNVRFADLIREFYVFGKVSSVSLVCPVGLVHPGSEGDRFFRRTEATVLVRLVDTCITH